MQLNNLPIGIFDSGVGGLTVLRELKNILPNEHFIYFGDTAHVPYGNKSKETIEKYCLNIVNFLNQKKVKLIIVACNTASSTALETLEAHTKTPILNVIDPSINFAINNKNNKSIGIIGTRTTIVSQAYEKKIQKFNKNIQVFSQECSLFVPIIEESLINHNIAQVAVDLYLKKLPTSLDILILGCTHYPLIKHLIIKHVNSQTQILDSSIIMAQHTKDFLIRSKLLSLSKKEKKIECYVSDDPTKFNDIATKMFNNFNVTIQKTHLK